MIDSRTLRLPGATLIAVALALPAVAAAAPARTLGAGPSPAAVRGRYLVTVMGCGDCHTPMKMGPRGPEPDRSRFLSGHPQGMKVSHPAPVPDKSWLWAGSATNTAFAGPWGISYAANLTSDPKTGIGSWTEANFVRALREGKHLGVGRPIAPPMPWPAFGQATDDDLRAIFAYLQTVPPIVNQPPDYQPPQSARR